jgi:hypothetical protein
LRRETGAYDSLAFIAELAVELVECGAYRSDDLKRIVLDSVIATAPGTDWCERLCDFISCRIECKRPAGVAALIDGDD